MCIHTCKLLLPRFLYHPTGGLYYQYYMSVLVSQSTVHRQLVDAYQKAITRYYQQLVTLLPIEDMMEDLMKGKIISHRQQVMIDSKHARAGKKICIYL